MDAGKRASSDQSIKGLKKLRQNDPVGAEALANSIVKNTYRTLMTRGMKGCYVYCTDEPLAEYLRSRLAQHAQQPGEGSRESFQTGTRIQEIRNVSPLRRVSEQERIAGVSAAPLVELKFAAGGFSTPQERAALRGEWVALPDWVAPHPDLFVAQVQGESMNKRIPNGSWFLFRAHPGGSRQGKVVVVQHAAIDDPETGGRYTIKRYQSQKVFDDQGNWRHVRIRLLPDSSAAGFGAMELQAEDEDTELQVIAEFLMVLSESA